MTAPSGNQSATKLAESSPLASTQQKSCGGCGGCGGCAEAVAVAVVAVVV